MYTNVLRSSCKSRVSGSIARKQVRPPASTGLWGRGCTEQLSDRVPSDRRERQEESDDQAAPGNSVSLWG